VAQGTTVTAMNRKNSAERSAQRNRCIRIKLQPCE
jgi:hypothetical protein